MCSAAYGLAHHLGSHAQQYQAGYERCGAGAHGTETADISIVGSGSIFIEFGLRKAALIPSYYENGIADEEILFECGRNRVSSLSGEEGVTLGIGHVGKLASGVRGQTSPLALTSIKVPIGISSSSTVKHPSFERIISWIPCNFSTVTVCFCTDMPESFRRRSASRQTWKGISASERVWG